MLALMTGTVAAGVILDRLLVTVLALERHRSIPRGATIHHRTHGPDLLGCHAGAILGVKLVFVAMDDRVKRHHHASPSSEIVKRFTIALTRSRVFCWLVLVSCV